MSGSKRRAHDATAPQKGAAPEPTVLHSAVPAAGGSSGDTDELSDASPGIQQKPARRTAPGGGRFSGRLAKKEDELKLVEECQKLAPLLVS